MLPPFFVLIRVRSDQSKRFGFIADILGAVNYRTFRTALRAGAEAPKRSIANEIGFVPLTTLRR